jgi:hypothetical protein
MSKEGAQKRPVRITEEHFPLGLLPGAAFTAHAVEMHSDDLLVIATDGIIEVSTPDDLEFGMEGLEDLLRSNASLPLPILAESILLMANSLTIKLCFWCGAVTRAPSTPLISNSATRFLDDKSPMYSMTSDECRWTKSGDRRSVIQLNGTRCIPLRVVLRVTFRLSSGFLILISHNAW